MLPAILRLVRRQIRARFRFRYGLTLCAILLFIYLVGSAWFMIEDQSLSTLGLVHNSDLQIRRLVRKTASKVGLISGPVCDAEAELVGDGQLGGGCYFRDRIQCDGMPTINSAFVDVVDKNVVIIGIRFRDETWLNDTFICEFPDGNVTVTDPVVNDDRSMGAQPQYVFIMTCPIAPGYLSAFSPPQHLPDKFRINLRKRAPPFKVYRNIPLCKAGWKKAHYLTICTMVKDVDDYFDDWLLYYRYMGVQHVYVYDNSDQGTLLDVLDRFIKLGFVTVIPWAHTFTETKTYLEVQIAHENDCLWRHRHDTEWLLKIDVDEFMQPMFPEKITLADFIREFETTLPPTVSAIRVRNWFFSRPPSNVSKQVMSSRTVIERNPWRSPEPTGEGRGREKCFIRPQKVHYFKIHAVKLGGDSLTLDPYTEIRLAHYRSENPRHRNFRIHKFILDTSMVELWHTINKWKLHTRDRLVKYAYRNHRYRT